VNPSATNCPSYKGKPIRDLASLAKALQIGEPALLSLALRADELYRVAKEVLKDDGTVRHTYDALKPLKVIHHQIKLKILDRVIFPAYLTGGIKGQDYKTNAALHSGAKIVISEDISAFFPTTTPLIVFNVWRRFFRFSDEVANCLTQLTTHNGELPQGGITSSQLANLVFWRNEATLHEQLAAKGITYSRFVDDVAVSSRTYLTSLDKTAVIASIYGMMKRLGYKPKRKKHEISTARERMIVTKLTVNEKPGLASKERAQIRAMVHGLERDLETGIKLDAVITVLPKVMGKVSKFGRFHPGKAAPLKKRLAAIKQAAFIK
jgi:hypothetical protein